MAKLVTAQRQHQKMPLWTVAVLALGPAVALGWARFGYGFLLPAMRQHLQWNYLQAGAINTAEATGYLLGALFADWFARIFGMRRTFRMGMIVVVIGLLGCAFTQVFGLLLTLRFIAGFGAAGIFSIGASLASNAAENQRRASTFLSIYTAGVGFGIAITALTIPYLLSVLGPGGWRWGWAALAGLSLISLGLVQIVLSHFPEIKRKKKGRWIVWEPMKKLVPISLGYGISGMGYVGYMTFFIAFLHQHGVSNTEIPVIWIILGSAVIAASFAWGHVIHRMRGGRVFALVLVILMTGVLLPLAKTNMVFFIASALFVGGSTFATPSVVFYIARNTLDPHHWTAAIGGLTICFGIGQALGPVLIGAISDIGGGVSAGLIFSAGLLLMAIIAGLFQKEPTKKQDK